MKKSIYNILISNLRIIKYNFQKIFYCFIKNYSVSHKIQEKIFESCGLNRESGLIRLQNIFFQTLNRPYDESVGMYSEHLVLLSAISLQKKNFENILEIGTYDGQTSFILSKLFQNSAITTIDLPNTSTIFQNTYKRNITSLKFIQDRNKILQQSSNISLIEINSIELALTEKKYDLIWIDGDHGYPTIAMDIINCFRLASKGAYILIDDVTINAKKNNIYVSDGAYESCKALKDANLIDNFVLFNKRLGKNYNFPFSKKYISFLIKK